MNILALDLGRYKTVFCNYNPTNGEHEIGRGLNQSNQILDLTDLALAAKAERCGCSIYVYLPFLAETQDEKMYRVVMDRERWFNVVMGEKYTMGARSTEKMAERIPLPETAAASLGFNLEI